MAPHVHVGLVEFLTVAAYTLIFSILWRIIAARLDGKHPTAAAAMTAVYS